MSVAEFLGLDSIGDKSVKDAQAAVSTAIEKLQPLFADIENRGGGILHGLLDRLNGTTVKVVDGGIQITIPSIPKAQAVNQ
jgi:hypothetical protein